MKLPPRRDSPAAAPSAGSARGRDQRAALVLHAACGLHDTGWGHPDHQGRLPAVIQALQRDAPTLLPVLVQREAEPAPEHALRAVHTAAHVNHIRRAAEHAAAAREIQRLDPDTFVSPESWNAATAAAGCALTAVALVMRGETEHAFALCRPPGHHALAPRAMGFCLFNNVAVAARALQREHGVRRILIIDWDVHHGNGTQAVFYDDPTVYYLSLHQAPWYPGTGHPDERGRGDGLGTTRNVPLPAGTTARDYLARFDRALDDTLAEFDPEFVLVSAGFDCMRGDPLGRFLLEPDDLHAMTRTVLDAARSRAGGRLALALEGGYAPERLGAGVVAVLRALAGQPPRD